MRPILIDAHKNDAFFPFIPVGADKDAGACLGFSLIEVILAIGVFGIAIVTILGLMSSLLASSKESWQETRAAQIARQILDDLRPANGEDHGSLLQATNAVEPVDIRTATNFQVFYTTDGLPIASGEPTAFFQINIALSSITNAPDTNNVRTDFREVRIDVSPIASGSNSRPFQFFSRIAPKLMEKP